VAIQEVRVGSLRPLIRHLEKLAPGPEGDFYVFRGHRKTSWRLTSTFARYATVKLPEFKPMAVEYLVSRFVHGLASIGNRELIAKDRRTFNGIRGSVDRGRVAVYAINWNYLGVAFSELARVMGWDGHLKTKYKMPAMDVFRWEIKDFFCEGYPQPVLKFLPYASSAVTSNVKWRVIYI
jgi:hypothetical protein